jgi:fatty acid desaturase
MLRFLPLIIIVVALLAAVFVPGVDRATLWLGMPPLVLVSIVGVALLTPLLALVEFTRTDSDDEEPRS